MRLTDVERERVRSVIAVTVPVIHEPNAVDWFENSQRWIGEAERTVLLYGQRGKHLNSLAWRVARRFGWRAAAVA